ncbi:NADP-dependent oxidoreductase [Saccharothrix variisporea]|uniref:NADPH:quinone reductase-like Zn-dependent oxidoreductase n=1 Tax=Saccharothrix variisporea TaxID=543527 RepID=A0A495X4X8_9PSEU|nr:NADP-dependent oxidoreductase [Saccharothrix variisporea]RKT69050.1 NADPH:quinone reductase-like Zn-dependent oxidoreductase [Saccharothrix variisporea]
MKAVVVTAYGPPETFTVGDVPVPRPGPGQVLVRVAAASINPGDVRLPSGDYRDVTPLDFPHVPGNDFAGTVAEVGPGVVAYEPGDEIFGQAVPRVLQGLTGSTRPSLSTGSLAEYAVFEADTPLLTQRPPQLSTEDAAALATTGLTARALLAEASPTPGDTVLVVGATGGVGTAVIPLFAHAGAHVIATTTPEDASLLRDLGAHRTVAYGEYPDVDLALNLVLPGNALDDLARAVRPGGRLLTITPDPRPTVPVDARFVLDLDGRTGGMRGVAEDVLRGALKATISRRYTLDQAPQACVDFVREHTTGKLVVAVR